MGNSNFQPSDLLQKETYKNEENVTKIVAVIKNYLDSKCVDINARNYKNTPDYMKIKNEGITGFPGGVMSLEEFIDRFMHTNCTFESIYDMGNPNEIESNESTDYAVATEIWYILSLDENGITVANVLDEL